MARAGLTSALIIELAGGMLDEHGTASFNLGALAERLGVKTPSLYKHIDGMAGVQRGVMLRAKADLGQVMRLAAVGRSREDATAAMSGAYRRWALDHPGQYPLTVRAAVLGDAEDETVSNALLEVVFAALRGYDLGDEDAIHATRFLRASLHGFVTLESAGAFEMAVDLERSFARLVSSVQTSLASWERT